MHHDPRQAVESFRGQLATHDKRISFLFGAGTSCAVSENVPAGGKASSLIPAIAGLTKACSEEVAKLGDAHGAAWKALVEECKAEKVEANIEVMLSRIRMKVDAMSNADEMLGINKDSLKKIETTISKTIASVVQPDAKKIPDILPHHGFARWIADTPRRWPIEIFTTNYDLLFEKALEDERVLSFDGFVGTHNAFFVPESLYRQESAPGLNWTRIWKIHGSVNWQWREVAGQRRIVRAQPVPTGEMILPSHYKYDESRKQPYLSLLDRLRSVLNQEDALLVTVGYSFGDDHINSVIFDALSARPRVHVYSLQFEEPADTSRLRKASAALRNLIVFGPNAASIGTKHAVWKLLEPIDKRAPDYLTVAFEASAAKEGEPDYLKGRFSLGDFNKFSKFLKTMSAN